MCVWVFILPTLSCEHDVTQGEFLSGVLQVSFQFSFFKTSSHTKIKENRLPDYLLIAGGGIIGFIPIPRLMFHVKCETLSLGF